MVVFLLIPFTHSREAPAASDTNVVTLMGGFSHTLFMGKPSLAAAMVFFQIHKSSFSATGINFLSSGFSPAPNFARSSTMWNQNPNMKSHIKAKSDSLPWSFWASKRVQARFSRKLLMTIWTPASFSAPKLHVILSESKLMPRTVP